MYIRGLILMAVKEILKLGNPCLYDTSKPVLLKEWSMLEEVMKDLHDTLMDFRHTYKAGRAVAAPQIGVMKRLIYLNIGEPKLLINPSLCFPDTETIELWDDCMSFPNLLVKVQRFKRCQIEYTDFFGKQQSSLLEGDLAELIQHEYDHLDGILATDRAIDKRSLKLKQV